MNPHGSPKRKVPEALISWYFEKRGRKDREH